MDLITLSSIPRLTLILLMVILSWGHPVTAGAQDAASLHEAETKAIARDGALSRYPLAWIPSSSNRISVSVLTPVEAENLFSLLKNGICIDFYYLQDGCFARAHAMTRVLESLGVIVAKAMLIGKLAAPASSSPLGSVHWGWHVAPLILIQQATSQNGEMVLVETVLDPGVFDGPAPLADWRDKITFSEFHDSSGDYRPAPNQTVITDRFAYLPGQQGLNSDWSEKDDRDTAKWIVKFHEKGLTPGKYDIWDWLHAILFRHFKPVHY